MSLAVDTVVAQLFQQALMTYTIKGFTEIEETRNNMLPRIPNCGYLVDDPCELQFGPVLFPEAGLVGG